MSIGAQIAIWVVGAVVAVILLARAIGMLADRLFNHVHVSRTERACQRADRERERRRAAHDETSPPTRETDEDAWIP